MTSILATAKAWAALIGAVLTALVGTLTPDDPAYRTLTMVLAVVTAVATYAVPNKPPVVVDAEPYTDDSLSNLDRMDGVGRHAAMNVGERSPDFPTTKDVDDEL